MKMKAFLTALAGLAMASAAHAATITFNLTTGVNSSGVATPGAFIVTATTSAGDNSGLASYTFNLANVTTTVSNRSAQQTFVNNDPDAAVQVEKAGFTESRASSAGGANTGTQDTVDYLTNITNGSPQNIILVYGIGQTTGNLSTLTPAGFSNAAPANNQAYGVPFLLASGTYTVGGAVPAITVAAGNVFTTLRNGTTIAGVPVISTPEPASLAVLGMGGVSLLARRRKTA